MLEKLKRLFSGTIRPGSLARLTLPVNILLVILLAYSVAQLSWKLYPQDNKRLSSTEKVSEGAVSLPIANVSPLDYAAIAGWHLFGRAGENKPAAVVEPMHTPETRLNLKLVGIFFTQDSSRALALIAEGNGDELSYGIGDQLPQSKARLEQILQDRVVLSRNGRLEALSLPAEENSDPAQGIDLPSEPPPDESEIPIPVEQAPSTLLEPEPIDASAIAGRFRDKVTTQPQALQELAQAVPYVQNGQFMGFRLRPGKDRELLVQLGLRAGDVITAVNGSRLDDPVKGLGFLQQLVNADQVDVQVMRNGKEIPFTFILNSQ